MGRRLLKIDPITRIEGHLGVRVEVDTALRKPTSNVWVFSTMFRGFEVFGIGRPPEDLPHINSRICGVCGASHANASTLAVDMAYGVSPYPLGVALRNLAYGMVDHVYDHIVILSMLEGPDYSELVVSKFTPQVYDIAKRTLAEHRDLHGLTRISDIMRELNPITGKLWRLAIKLQKLAREAGVLIYGRHSHPSTLIPGGIMTDLTNLKELQLKYMNKLIELTAWLKWFYLIWHDLLSFFENEVTLPNGLPYSCNGLSYAYTREPNECSGLSTSIHVVASAGIFDSPEAYGEEMPEYDPIEFYKSIDKAATKRAIRPGIVVDGELASTSIKEYNRSVMEHVERAFYDDWSTPPWFTSVDPEGVQLLHGKYDARYHPWNKITIPKPGSSVDWLSKYTWTTHVRLVWKDGRILPFEVGPYARLLASSMQSYRLEASGVDASIKMGARVIEVELPRTNLSDIPQALREPFQVSWKVPRISTTIYRLWARAFNLLVDAAALWANLLWLIDHAHAHVRLRTSRPWKVPKGRTYGVGMVEAPRGTVRHWVVQENGRVLNIQIQAPTTSNASPRDKFGLSPYEQSVANTFITEEMQPSEWQGLDIVRTVRSFDPCLACAVHITVRRGGSTIKVIEKMVTKAYYEI